VRATFAAHGSSVRCPLHRYLARCLKTANQTCGLAFHASPFQGIAPSRGRTGSSACPALLLPIHLHFTVLTSAYPRHYPRPWLLEESLPVRHTVGTCSGLSRSGRTGLLRSQFSLFASVGRCSPPGFSTVQTGHWFRMPVSYPVPFGSSVSASCAGLKLRWLHHTFAYAAHRCLLNGIPGVRLPGSAFYPRFRPLRTNRRPGGYAVTPAPGGRGFHPHEEPSYKADALRLAREPRLSFSQRIARNALQCAATLVRLPVLGNHHTRGVRTGPSHLYRDL